jgi:hypothetical protein
LATGAAGGDALSKSDVLKLAKELAGPRYQQDPVTEIPSQAFAGDLRSTSALCLGDFHGSIGNHTSKWNQPELGVSPNARAAPPLCC